jgi:hypothetical protein
MRADVCRSFLPLNDQRKEDINPVAIVQYVVFIKLLIVCNDAHSAHNIDYKIDSYLLSYAIVKLRGKKKNKR